MVKKMSGNFFMWVLITTVLILFISIFMVITLKPAILNTKTVVSKSVAPQSNTLKAQINHYKELLKNKELSEEARKSLEEKLAMVETQADLYAQVNSGIGSESKDLQAKVQTSIDPDFATGIFNGDEGIFSPSVAVINTYYQTPNGDAYTQAFAGKTGADPQQGVIIIAETSADRLTTNFTQYLTPVKEGAVRIENVDNGMLFLRTESDNTLVFDLFGRVFK